MNKQLVTGRIGHLTETTINSIRKDWRNINFREYRKTGRLVAHIGPDYAFSGSVIPGQDWDLFPGIHSLMLKLSEAVGVQFNSCLINHYTKGKAVGIGAHTDKEACLVPNSPVVSVSLGIDSDCQFILRDIKTKKVVHTFKLSHGDVFLMDSECQNKFTHEIPKTLFPNGRVSLTFRVFKGCP